MTPAFPLLVVIEIEAGEVEKFPVFQVDRRKRAFFRGLWRTCRLRFALKGGDYQVFEAHAANCGSGLGAAEKDIGQVDGGAHFLSVA